MNSSPFLIWLDKNIQQGRKSRNIDRDGRTVTLKEEKDDFHMHVKIENASRRLVVVNFEQDGKATTYFEGGRGFGDRCDFLVLDETEDEYVAYLIELEAKVPSKHGASQLRWSAPYLKYILAVFLEDSRKTSEEKKLTLKYYQIGKEYQSWIKRKQMKREKGERFTKWDEYHMCDVYYCTYEGHRIEFRDFGITTAQTE